jgi:hypothetical protein
MLAVASVPRPRPRADTVTEESVPEILLYEGSRDRESSPMIHVVPMESFSPDFLDAVSNVIGDSSPPTLSKTATAAAKKPSTKDKAAGLEVEKPADNDADSDDETGDQAGVPGTGLPRDLVRKVSGSSIEYVPIERGGAAAGEGGRPYSAPRRVKRFDIDDEDTAARTGNTAKPPGPVMEGSSAKRPAVVPPADELADTQVVEGSARNTKEGPPPLPGTAKARRGGKIIRSLPERRELLSTNDFTGEESVACQACGSVISRRAEHCLYCGAPTGLSSTGGEGESGT